METRNDTFIAALAQMSASLAGFFEHLKNIDWQKFVADFNARIKQQIKDARTLAGKGWTIPGWLTVPQTEIVMRLSEDELDDFFTDAYCADGFKVLNETFDNLKASPGMVEWLPMLDEVRVNLTSGRHLLTVPALLAVLEGFAVKHILTPSGTNTRGTTNLARLFADMGRHEMDSIEALLWVSNLAFMQKLFANSVFDGSAPEVLNRHWVLHGRTECNWRFADALRLVNALEMLVWLEELESTKRLVAEKESENQTRSAANLPRPLRGRQ
jgi:hypothetical protein